MTSILSKTPPAIVNELHKEAVRMKATHLRDLLSDEKRNQELFKEYQGVILDLSRQKIDISTYKNLIQMCDDMNLSAKIDHMMSGGIINETENRSVLHTALRAPANEKLEIDGKNVLADVHAVLTRIKKFAQQIRSGELVGHTGKVLKDVVCVGIGGSFLGTDFVHQALKSDPVGKEKSKDRQLRFCANVDPVDVDRATEGLFPETTLVIVVSKTFTTAETMLNARTLKNWLLNGLKSDTGVSKHLAAVSTNLSATSEFGISADRVFGFWDWVGGRFSVCSAVGMLPLAMQYGGGVIQDFLDGCHMMDTHFRKTPASENIPMLMGILSVWNSTFLGFGDVAVLPYAQALHKFPAHIQQLTMESNGKRVAMNGEELTQHAGEVFFGDAGTNAQHSFYQLMHQGRTIPAEFIGFCKSQFPVDLPDEPVSNHDELMSNYFAQCDALAYGKTSAQCVSEGVSPNLVSHKTFPGDRPSALILMPECNAYYVGCLLSIYEHRTAVEGFLWGVNSFDQWGVELGKVLAKQVRSYFNKQRKNLAGAADALEVLPKPTQRLIQLYVENSKDEKK